MGVGVRTRGNDFVGSADEVSELCLGWPSVVVGCMSEFEQ